MRCPNCDQALAAGDYESATLHTCNSCHGEFVSSSSLRDIVNHREQLFPTDLLERFASREPQFDMSADSRATACPSCELPMTPINYACDTGVIVDRCNSCGGVWLDADELEAIQIILERWEDQAPTKINTLNAKRAAAKRAAQPATCGPSRFAFINAIINRLADRAA